MEFRSVIRLAAAALALAGGEAAAQNCGDTLTSSTLLSSDLHCPHHPYALRIDTPGIVLDLGGHAVSARSVGVLVESADSVTITGPGTISGLGCRWPVSFDHAGVRALDADLLEVRGIDFVDVPIAVSTEGGSKARIHANRIRQADFGVVVFDAPARGRKAYSNEISANDMEGDPNCGMQGAWIEGEHAQHNIVVDNSFKGVTDGVYVAASRNLVGNNRHAGRGISSVGGVMIGTGIYIAAGSANEVLGNELADVSTGVYVWPAHYDSRTGALRLDAFDNQIIGNRIEAAPLGALVGAGGGLVAGIAASNRLHENHFSAPIGIWFAVNARRNDGRGNAYPGAATPVVDHGSRNLWP
ncbi:MAG: hypothetical protein LW860_18510 [Xanthomonadaceae bacterium]|jgi:nitrous oxidase accessory protein NosD|nr:hypothetical protein [Xanthomonadaceae bacterium]